MKRILIWLLLPVWAHPVLCQTKINKTFTLTKGQQVEFRFDYPKIIKISTWDKPEIALEASIEMEGEASEAFFIENKTENNTLYINNRIDFEKIPELNTIVLQNGESIRFESKDELEKYRKENKSKVKYTSYNSKNITIHLELKVPINTPTVLYSTYGMVEMANYKGPIRVIAKYGGLDISLREEEVGQIKLTNQFGKIYTNMSLKPTASEEKNFYTSITAAPGKGPTYDMSTSFGNIYVRKVD